MSYPYFSDFINDTFGTDWNLPIPMFGAFVALAIFVATAVAKMELLRLENLGVLPKVKLQSNLLVPVHTLLGDLTFITVIFGILGARVFHLLEYPQEFFEHPLEMILSRNGFSIYGGMIFGMASGVVFFKKRNVPITPLLDAFAPSMILGYGIGRMGCQVSGDGDWGTAANLALKPHWLPDWFWSQTYDNNIVGVIIPAPGVYPTPVYELLTALCIFIILWSLRKALATSGLLFSIYLVLSGFGRLLIEKIRINTDYYLFGFSFTQAELISVALILLGLAGTIKTSPLQQQQKIALSILIFGALVACAKL